MRGSVAGVDHSLKFLIRGYGVIRVWYSKTIGGNAHNGCRQIRPLYSHVMSKIPLPGQIIRYMASAIFQRFTAGSQ